eukprot:1137554-Pelagomonas_calceolata.AAC.4
MAPPPAAAAAVGMPSPPPPAAAGLKRLAPGAAPKPAGECCCCCCCCCCWELDCWEPKANFPKSGAAWVGVPERRARLPAQRNSSRSLTHTHKSTCARAQQDNRQKPDKGSPRHCCLCLTV